MRVKLDDGISTVRKEKVPELEGQHERVSRWPMSFRPEGYDFGGDPIACPSH